MSVNEINEGTQYSVSYEEHKRGRATTTYAFTMDCSNIEQAKVASKEDGNLEMLPPPKDRHGLSKQAVVKLISICGSKEEFEFRMNYALELLAKRKEVSNATAFIYRAIERNYRQADLNNQLVSEREAQALQDKYEWEQVAMEMFDESIPVNEDEPARPFTGNATMVDSVVQMLKNDLREYTLGRSTRRILEEHNMSIKTFLEIYGGLTSKRDNE